MSNLTEHNPLFISIKQLIEDSKQQVAVTVNATMSMLYWRIGKQINEELLQNSRAEYGEQVIKSLASQLHGLYGKGWSEKQLRLAYSLQVFLQMKQLSLRCGDN